MAMQRMTITMAESDIDDFERGRSAEGMTKSAYIRLLIAEHENRVPEFIYNKEIIARMAQIDTDIKQLILQDIATDREKLILFESIRDLKSIMKNRG